MTAELDKIINELAEYRTKQFELNKGAFKTKAARKNFVECHRKLARQRLEKKEGVGKDGKKEH